MFTDPEFWVAIAFLLAMGLIFRPVARALIATLDGRAARIRVQIEEARKLREDAQALLASYQKKQREALAEAEKIIAQARQEAARLKVEAEKDLENAITRRRQQALERIAQSEAQAIASVHNTAVDVALAAAEKLIASSLDPAKRAALADKAISELPARMN